MVLEIPNVVVACSIVNSCSLNVTQNAESTVDLLRQACSNPIRAKTMIHVLHTRRVPIPWTQRPRMNKWGSDADGTSACLVLNI